MIRTRTRLLLATIPIALAALCVSCGRTGSPSTARKTSETRNQATSHAPAPVSIFEDITASAGIDFHHVNGATGRWYFPEIMGSGVAVLDFDGDGASDIFCVQGGMIDPSKSQRELLYPPPPGWKPGCRLYRNRIKQTGKLQFEDVTERSGIKFTGYGMGVAVGDYDNDGRPDIFITGYGGNALYRNKGDGSFEDVTTKAGVRGGLWSSSAAFVDYDGDGWLDLVVVNYTDFTVATNKACYSTSGAPDYCSPSSYRGTPSTLYHNERNGKFRDVSAESGLGTAIGPGLGVACADLNGDGRTDIFIANDGAANHLWLNQGSGKFREAALTSGVAFNQEGSSRANMGIALGDFADDGTDAICVTHLIREGVSFYRGDGKGAFRDASAETGVLASTQQVTGFGTEWLDYDNDRFLDLIIANGAVTRMDGQNRPYPFEQTNQLFHNLRGSRLEDVSASAGPVFQRAGVGRGVAVGDFDNDGGLDVVVTNNNGPARLLHNVAPGRGHWLLVRLVGVRDNRMGLGARVGVTLSGGQTVWRRCHTDGSYASSSDSRVHFGLGTETAVKSVEVRWPSGARETWPGPKVDSIITLRQDSGNSQ